jgi:hypothetical protein
MQFEQSSNNPQYEESNQYKKWPPHFESALPDPVHLGPALIH